MECMVLSQFFPSNGIDGVIEEPIYGPEIDDLRDAVDAQYSEEIFFHRLVKSKGRANDWFLPGDVVCRRLSLDEERSDVLRKLQDKIFVSSSYDWSLYEDELETMRTEAIEHHRWKIHRGDVWCAIIDPQGRALVVVRTHANTQWRKAMEQIVPRMVGSKNAATPHHRVSAAWCALKALHRFFINEHKGTLSISDVYESEHFVRQVYNHRLDIGQFSGSGRIIKMYKYRNKLFDPFWQRCFDLLESGEQVPFVVRHIYRHPCTRWVAISVDDAEWLLSCSWWSEWKKFGPIRFDKFKKEAWDANHNWH